MKTQFIFSILLVLANKGTNSAVVPNAATCPPPCACSVQEVLCSEKNLTDIPTIEQGAELIVRLDVSNNNIQLLSNNMFKHYTHLETIDASKNQIAMVESGTFHSLDYIQGVDLSENAITFIHPDTFSQNPNLQTVNLSGNPLMKLSINFPILNAPMVRSLDLSFCKLTSVTTEMLKGMTKLTSLDIRNNEISYFEYEILIDLENLVEIKLDNNSWMCKDCTLLNVLNVLTVRNPDFTEAYEGLTCMDENGHSKMMLSVLNEPQSCNNEVDGDGSINVGVPERTSGVYFGLWFQLQRNSFSAHTLWMVSILLTVIIICTALCMTVLKRCIVRHDVSCNDQQQMKTKNLMLAFAEPEQKRGSLLPLLPPATPDDCPSSPPEWTPTGVEHELYHDFLMSRLTSEHNMYGRVDYGRIGEL